MLTVACERKLTEYLTAGRWRVAFSGGVDSCVLLHLLLQLPEHPPIDAIHINHQLQPQADAWVDHCRQQAEKLGVDLQVAVVSVQHRRGESLEECARKARYQALESLLSVGDILMMGHHRDDQVETLMLRLLRGSGNDGLGAMADHRPLGPAQLVRPLLDCDRADIEAYANQHQLRWVDDPSNLDTAFDRNYLRHLLLPIIQQRWPQYRKALARVARLQRESAALNQALAELDWQQLQGKGARLIPATRNQQEKDQQQLDQQASAIENAGHQQLLPINPLQKLSVARQKNLLRYWLHRGQFSPPAETQMHELLDQMVNAEEDASPCIRWRGVELRRYMGQLYAMKPLEKLLPPTQRLLHPGQAVTVPGVGVVSLCPGTGRGLRAELLAAQGCRLEFRRGGERCRPAGRRHSQTLKKLFQEYRVEPWLRDRVPLLYLGDELAAVADYWVCEGFAAAPDEASVDCHWQRP